MSKINNKYKHILELDESIYPKRVSYMSPKNIKDILIISKLKNTISQIPENTNLINKGCYKCNQCYLCMWILYETDTFSSMHTNQVFKINEQIDCNTEGIISLIDCLKHERWV